MQVRIRDARTDGYCASTRIVWSRFDAWETSSKVVQDCAGVWRTFTMKPASGAPIPFVEPTRSAYLMTIFATIWSGRLAHEPSRYAFQYVGAVAGPR